MSDLNKMQEKVLTYESNDPFTNEIEIANKLKKKQKMANERATWGTSLDFFLSVLGYAVGIGNVWRFPYMCYKNGGGVFLIPYFTCMFLLGMPMVYLEFVVGQFTSCGPLTSFKMVRISRGIGLSINIANCFFVMFFNMIIAYALYFLFSSFNSHLPWSKCNSDWASPNCVDDFSSDVFTFTKCDDQSTLFKCDVKGSALFGRCFNKTTFDGKNASCNMNATLMHQVGFWKTSFPSADYWEKVVLERSDSIEESGSLVWHLVLSLFGVYLIVYFMMIKGIKVSGKAVYFTALFPYFVLLILGIRAWFLEGAIDGIRYYTNPNWSKLGDIRVWSDAATAIFFSISISFGGMTTLASYNKFNATIMRDAIMIPAANCLTSFFAGFVIFAYMGYLSHITGQDIDNIIEAGQGLAYIVYPYAITTLSGAPFWAILFFFMLVLLGISSTLAMIEVTIASFLDAFHSFSRTKLRRYITITAIFITYFVLGLLFCLQSGTYWIEIFNTYTGDWAILIIGASECIIVSYLYGLNNFINDIKTMLGETKTRVNTYAWCVLWCFVSPTLCISVAIFAFTKLKNCQIGDYVFPDWTLFLGQFMQGLVIFGLFGGAVYAIIESIFKKKDILSLFKPDFESYIPKLQENQKLVRIQRGLEKEENGLIIDNLSFSAEDMQQSF